MSEHKRAGGYERENYRQGGGRGIAGDDYWAHDEFNTAAAGASHNSGQQVGYRMRDLQTGQVTLFNPKADNQEQVFVPENRGGGGSGRGGMMNAPSQRQNWPPNDSRANGLESGRAPWTNNPMYAGENNQTASYDNREYYDSRGEFYPPRNPNQYQQGGGYYEYDTRGHEQFYDPRDRRQQHSAQQPHHQYADHHKYQDQSMFPSGDWGSSQPQTNDYHSTVPWNQSKDQQQQQW